MRLLFVHERFGAHGGAEVNLFLTASELRKRGHNLSCLHGAPTGQSEEAWRELFENRFALGKGKASSSATAQALREFQPDLIYVHKTADLHVLRSLLKSASPVVRMVHDHDLYCMRSYRYHPLTRKVCRRAASAYCLFPCGAVLTRNRGGFWPIKWTSYLAKRKELSFNRRFSRMVVATDYMKQELMQNGFDPSHIEIHAPVPPMPEVPLQSSFSPLNLLVYAGQVIRGKGVDVLLEALTQVQTPFKCVILGEGSHRPFCQALSAQLGLANRVSFKGYVRPEDMPAHYSDASVAVMSSIWPEPFGAVGLEAMRYGLPVVAFDVGGVGEWLIDGQNGFLVPRMDRSQYAARLTQLLRDKPLARKLGNSGRQLLREKFSFAAYITGLETLFERVIAEKQDSIVASPSECVTVAA
jgi:glycosyltransferase involved in cell wall biosynthesis